MSLFYIEAILLGTIIPNVVANSVSIFSRNASPATIKGCSLVTSAMSSVLGCSGS